MFEHLVGASGAPLDVVVERAPVLAFIDAVRAPRPDHGDGEGDTHGDAEPLAAPPTYSFVLPYWARLVHGGPQEVEDPVTEVVEELKAQGNLLLHGEQEFTYERPVLVGDRLTGRETLLDISVKDGSSGTLTFVVSEFVWRDDAERVVTRSRRTVVLKPLPAS